MGEKEKQMVKENILDAPSPRNTNLQRKIVVNSPADFNSGKSDADQQAKKYRSVLKSSIFNAFFQDYSTDIWTAGECESDFQVVEESMQGDVYAKDWCFRISKEKKMEWLYIKFIGQYAIAYTDENCKTPLAYFDVNFTKLEYLEVEMDEFKNKKSYYGLRFEKLQQFEEIFHPNKDFIANLGQDLSNHCVLPNFAKDYQLIQSLGVGNFSEVFECEHKITNEKCAVKVLEKAKILERNDFGQLLYEITTLKSLNEQKNKFC